MSFSRGIIYSALREYADTVSYRFHTPGHKGEYSALDITEIGIHGEIFPADCIERAERETAKLYGAQSVRYLTGGSSMGIKAALLRFKGKKVLYAEGAHRAFSEGCELADIRAVCLNGEDGYSGTVFCGCDSLPPPATLEGVESALNAHPDAAAVYITSPDYLGRTADIRIAELCRRRGVKLIADAAHGAHFAFAPGLREYGFERAADYANMSAHKTLGAYTQSALITVNDCEGGDIDRELRLLGTTSPNYEMLARLECSVVEASGAGEQYERLKRFTQSLPSELRLKNTDYTRLCVPHKDPKRLYAELYRRGIVPEAVIDKFVVFILTPQDGEEKTAKLYKELTRILS